ncbi:hypothetical protein BDF22DRAFT_741748 [Syncephalis plumigaleata]|nr:hypothetical protein BDF22DRAFT_741748 [Syncephalis plumigaleata]
MGWTNANVKINSNVASDANTLDISGFPWDSARLLLIVCIIGVLAGCFYYAWTSARDALRGLRALERQHLLLESELNGSTHKKEMRTMHTSRPASPATMALLAGAALYELEEKRRRNTSPLRNQRYDHHSPSSISHTFSCRTPSPPSRMQSQSETMTMSTPIQVANSPLSSSSSSSTSSTSSSPIGLGMRGLPSIVATSKST